MAFETVEQPIDFGERCVLARRTMQELALDLEVWVDDMGDQSRALFGDLPNPAVVIDPIGEVRVKQPWMDPAKLRTALDALDEDLPTEMDWRAKHRAPRSDIGAPLYQLLDPKKAELGRTNLTEMLETYEADNPLHVAAAIRGATADADPLAGVAIEDRHLRHTMLAALVEARPEDARCAKWLDELVAAEQPLQQAWAWGQRKALATRGEDEDGAAAADAALRELRAKHPWLVGGK